jgi:hypothetical protein
MANKKWNKEQQGGELSKDEKEGVMTFFKKSIIYSIFLILFAVAFMNITLWSNFIAFIFIFIIHIISGFYILKDIFTNESISEKLSSNEKMAFTTDNGQILLVFIIILVIGFIFKFVSMAIMIAVFDYGRHQTPSNDYNTYGMTQANRDLVNNYKSSFKRTTMTFLLLAFFVIMHRFSPETQTIIRNTVCMILSIALLGMTINEVVKASEFLKIKQRHQDLYVVLPKNTQTDPDVLIQDSKIA